MQPNQLEDGELARKLLRASIDSLLDPQVLMEAARDAAGRVTDFVYRELNQATCDYLGLFREDLLGHSFVAMSPGVVESGLFARYVHCLETGDPVVIDDLSYDNEILQQTRRYDLRATRATPSSITLTWRDVTDRFRAAQLLAQTRDLLRASMDSLLDSQVLFEAVRDDGGRVVDFVFRELNQATCDYLGVPRERLLGISLLEGLPGAAESGLFDAYVECLESGLPVIVDDYAYSNKAFGETRRYDIRATRATPDIITLTVRDVTERFRAMQLLARARDLRHKADLRYRRLVDNSAIGVSLISPEGRFETANQAMCEFFGYDADTLRVKTWQELTAPAYLDVYLRNVRDVAEGRIESYRMTKQYIHADGHHIWGHLSVSCLRTSDGGVESYIVQITDITAEMESRRKLAERDEQNRELARRLQEQTDRLTGELRSAAAYVRSILPVDLVGPVRVSSRYLASEELAGDSFDYRWIDDDHLIVYLIDVSGHGIGPALLSVSVHNMLRSGALFHTARLAPERVLSELNRRFQMEHHGGRYMTMWCGVYELSSRTLRYASAGAPPAFAIGGDAGVVELSTRGQPLGLFSDADFTARSYTVPPGCRILLYSDGAYEEAFDDGRQLSIDELKALFNRSAESSLDDFIVALRALRPSGGFEDDCSLIRMEFD
ncbi:MAG: PAS domain S-box protein [Mycobacterium sp.]|nr:MAG: PAS domain S-box protein [Mycobacterium sp.]